MFRAATKHLIAKNRCPIPLPAKPLPAELAPEPGFACSKRWSPERTFVLAKKAAGGFSGIQELSEPGFRHPSPVPFEAAPRRRGVPGMLMKLFQARAGARCAMLPRPLVSPATCVFWGFPFGGWSLASRQSYNDADFCIF